MATIPTPASGMRTPGVMVFCDHCGDPEMVPERTWANFCKNKSCAKFGHILVIPCPKEKRYVKINCGCEGQQYACIPEKQPSIRCSTCDVEHIVDTVALTMLNGQPVYESVVCTAFIKRRLMENDTLKHQLAKEHGDLITAVSEKRHVEIELGRKIEKLEEKMNHQKTSYTNEFKKNKETVQEKTDEVLKLKNQNELLTREVEKLKEEKEKAAEEKKEEEKKEEQKEPDAVKLHQEWLNYYINLSEEQKIEIRTLKNKCEELESTAKKCREVVTLEYKMKMDAVAARDKLDKQLMAVKAELEQTKEQVKSEKSAHLQLQMNWNELLESVEAANFIQTEARLKTKEAALDESAALLQETLKKNDVEVARLKCQHENETRRLKAEIEELRRESKGESPKRKPFQWSEEMIESLRQSPAILREAKKEKLAQLKKERLALTLRRMKDQESTQPEPKKEFKVYTTEEMTNLFERMFGKKEEPKEKKKEDQTEKKEDQ